MQLNSAMLSACEATVDLNKQFPRTDYVEDQLVILIDLWSILSMMATGEAIPISNIEELYEVSRAVSEYVEELDARHM